MQDDNNLYDENGFDENGYDINGYDINGYMGPSKTTLKKESHAFQDLGIKLSEMNDEKLARLPLDETLLRAIVEFRSIRKLAARKRHMQFVGKLIRNSNHEAIQAATDSLDQEHLNDARRSHVIEQWRDRLMSDDGNAAMNDLFDTYPDADRQQIRQLIKNALKEKSQNKPPVSARKLFKSLRTLLSANTDELELDEYDNSDDDQDESVTY